MLNSTASLAVDDVEQIIKAEQGNPIKITADSLLLRDSENMAIFKRNVVASQGRLSLNAQEMTAYTRKIPNSNRSEIIRIEAFEDIIFTARDRKIYSQRAEYNIEKGKIELFDQIKFEDGPNIIEGDKFIYNILTGKSNLSSTKNTDNESRSSKSSGRVRARIVPESNEVKRVTDKDKLEKPKLKESQKSKIVQEILLETKPKNSIGKSIKVPYLKKPNR
jgi:lipopolysaccharide transport protein LptA